MADFATLPGGNITSGEGSSYIDADTVFAGSTAYNNLIKVFGGNDTVYAGTGNDTVSLGAGNDWASGGTGTDKVIGGLGADTVFGDDGNDTLFGGADKDSFVFQSSFGSDVVLDFTRGNDVLSIQSHINGLNITTPG